MLFVFFFFFQAEDGIRDGRVTGVQTCALPISMNTPWFQSRAWVTSGMVVLRRPPNRIAEIGTPRGSSYSGARIGHCVMGVQKRLLGCAAGVDACGVQSWPCQSVRCAGGVPMPSHHTSPSSVRATLVNSELPRSRVRMALGLVVQSVPGATPNRPYSGLTA